MAKPTILSVGVTAEQEASIRHNMRVTGETNLSAHLRDVYFSKDRGNDALIGEMRREIGALTDTVERLQKLLRTMAATRGDGLELKLLAAVYLLLHPSVDTGVQATVDRYIDFDGVEAFLKDKGKRA